MGIKGVIVAAGYGTRFLPVTRCVPKEMLPLVDRPAIDLVVEELVEAGVDEVIVITSRRKKVLEDWFDRDPELDALFAREGAVDKAARIVPPPVKASFVRQAEMRGTGHALLQVRPFLGDDAAIVAYPDDLFGAPNCSAQLIETWRATGCAVLSAHDLPEADLTRYGVLDVQDDAGVLRLKRIVEKPPAGQAPSSLVSYGRYLYTPRFFELLEQLYAEWDGRGEYYPQDATNVLAAEGGVVVRVVDAPRHDVGTPLGFMQAATRTALAREDIGAEFRAWLKEELG